MHSLPPSWFANSAGCRQIPACNLNPEQFQGGKMSFCQSCGAALAGAQGETWGLFFRTIRKFDGRRVESKISLSLRPEGKQPRVANMLVEDHLRPAATKAAFFLLAEIGTDSKTIQDIQRWVDPSIMLKVYAQSRMDKRMEAQAKMIEAMGLNEETAQQFIQ